MQNDEQSPSGGVTPHITIRDGRAAEAIEFYKRAFGAEEQMRHASNDGRLMHAHLKINGGSLMMHDDFPQHSGGPAKEPAGTILHLEVDDADEMVDPCAGGRRRGQIPARRPVLGSALRPAHRSVRPHLVDRRAGQAGLTFTRSGATRRA